MKHLLLFALGCLAGSATATAQTVVQNFTYTGTVTVSGPTTIDAHTNVTVASGATLTYQASSSIRLGPGFTAVSGSNFRAQLVAGETQPPSVPSGLAASGLAPTVFTLSWNASTDNVGVAGYEIRRDAASIGTVNALSAAINNGIAPNTTYAMTVRAYDAAGNYSAWSSALSVTTPGSGPGQTVLLSPASPAITAGQSVTFTASGGQNGYVWGGSASGSGTTKSVLFNTAGTYSVTVYSPAGGSYNQSNTATSTITVSAVSSSPVITSSSTASGTLNTFFSYGITATNGPTSFNATGLPAGLNISSSTGVISGTPTSTGTSSISLSATNSFGTGTASLTLTITPPGDSDSDGIPNAIEQALGTNQNSPATPDNANQTELKVHRPRQ